MAEKARSLAARVQLARFRKSKLYKLCTPLRIAWLRIRGIEQVVTCEFEQLKDAKDHEIIVRPEDLNEVEELFESPEPDEGDVTTGSSSGQVGAMAGQGCESDLPEVEPAEEDTEDEERTNLGL